MQTEHLTSCATDIVTQRNRYFSGKYMTARDFASEQQYFLSRHRLHNRLFHGWGIVLGLDVIHHKDPDCAARWVIVKPGIAIDCCGRELFWQQEEAVKLPPPMPQGEDAYLKIDPTDLEPVDGPFLLCLRYAEQEIEPVPALYSDDSCDPTYQEANRIREKTCLQVIPLADANPECWKIPDGHIKKYWRDDCDTQLPGPAGSGLEANCPCEHLVPLALIHYKENPDDGFWIEMNGRQHLPIPADFLTHITHINWPHGGAMPLSRLRRRNGELKVWFDRQILLPERQENEGIGINEFTFVVQYSGLQRSSEYLSGPVADIRLEDDNRVAVFTIPPHLLTNENHNIAGYSVHITLKCDFIMDCHGNPVDGNHLRGILPSGNGTPGGIFESWFRVVTHDREEENEE